jgi:hypothetical protein
MTASVRAPAASAPVPDVRTASTAALLRSLFPHDRLSQVFYTRIAAAYVAELGRTPGALEQLDQGLGKLDASHIAPFLTLPAVIQKSLVEQNIHLSFLAAALMRAPELLYRDPEVWAMIGYQGSSIQYGGYKNRGFDDIDWLPQAGAIT